MKAVLRRIRISPKKANLVAGMVRGKPVNESLNILKFIPKKGADILYKVLHSAAYNAKNNFKQDLDDLVITRILVTKGPTYKRTLPVSRGRSHPILKRTCHITVEVGVPEGLKKETREAKVTKSSATHKEEATKEVSAKKTSEKKVVKKKESSKKDEPVKEVKTKTKAKKETSKK